MFARTKQTNKGGEDPEKIHSESKRQWVLAVISKKGRIRRRGDFCKGPEASTSIGKVRSLDKK